MTGDAPEASSAVAVRRRPSLPYRVVRLLLITWFVAYPVISFGPVLVGFVLGGDAGSMATVTGVILGAAFLFPWLIGLVVLGLLAWATH